MSETKRKPGRPKQPADEGKHARITVRIPTNLKERLQAAAVAAHVPTSTEIQTRLEVSFQQDELGLIKPQDLGGVNLAALFKTMAMMAKTVTPAWDESIEEAPAWTQNADQFAAVAKLWTDFLNGYTENLRNRVNEG